MNSKSHSKNDFKVIIAGGGIAGLTLANCFERAGISYTLLESRSTIGPQIGASIGILPNGARILDQLGVFDILRTYVDDLKADTVWIDEGKKKLVTVVAADLIAKRSGYPSMFTERQIVLRHLFENLENQSCILPGRKVQSVKHGENGVVVSCANGETYDGDVVVACDGVHSIVREEMRRYAELQTPGLMAKDRNSLSAEYLCLFGISPSVPGIGSGYLHRTYQKGYSSLTIGNPENTFLFIFKKLPKRFYAPNIPRYTKSDELEYAASFINQDFQIGNGVKFADFWERRTSSALVATEEAQNDIWTWGRFVCAGDSIAKNTPNAGAGGNASIESAAALANSLYQLVHQDNTSKITYSDVQKALTRYYDSRKERSEAVVKDANALTRIEAFATTADELTAKWLFPYAGDYMADLVAAVVVGAAKIDFLPEPERSKSANMPFHPEHGIGKGGSIWMRLLKGSPLLVCAFAARHFMNLCVVQYLPFLEKALKSGLVMGVPVKTTYIGWLGLDDAVRFFVTGFATSMGGLDLPTMLDKQINIYSPARLQMTTFIADLLPVSTIWLIESNRRGNALSIATIPILFMVCMQIFCIGRIAPIFYYLCYISLPPSKYHAADNRLVRTSYAKTLIPTLVLGYVVPSLLMYWPANYFSFETLQNWNYVWQLYPIWIVLLHGAFARMVKDTTITDKLHNVKADLPYLRAAYLLSILVAATSYIYVYLVSPMPLSQLLMEGMADPWRKFENISEAISMLLKYDWFFSVLSSAVWILLCFGDLKGDKRLSVGWGKILTALIASSVVLGPGAGMAVMWWWREEVLARR